MSTSPAVFRELVTTAKARHLLYASIGMTDMTERTMRGGDESVDRQTDWIGRDASASASVTDRAGSGYTSGVTAPIFSNFFTCTAYAHAIFPAMHLVHVRFLTDT